MKQITLVTGGEKCGKSSYALNLAGRYGKKAFIATSEPFDEGMRRRIAKHQSERDKSFITVEEPLDLAGALKSLPDDIEVALIDCLTVWMGNLLHKHGIIEEQPAEVSAFIERLKQPGCDLIIVTNEVGMGIIPHNDLARRFRFLAGLLNQAVAGQANKAVLMISGLPLVLKDE